MLPIRFRKKYNVLVGFDNFVCFRASTAWATVGPNNLFNLILWAENLAHNHPNNMINLYTTVHSDLASLAKQLFHKKKAFVEKSGI